MVVERFAIRNILAIFCLLFLVGPFIIGDELFDESAEVKTEKEEDVVPYARVCYVNHGVTVDIHMGGMQLFQDGELRLNSSVKNNGTLVDLDRDLKINRKSAQFYVGGDISIDAFRLSYDFSRAIFRGENTLGTDTTIDGVTFSGTSSLKSHIEYEWSKAIIGYSMFTTADFAFGFDLGFDLFRIQYDFLGTSATTGSLVRKVERKFLPVLKPGLHLDVALADPFILSLTVNGMVYEYDDIDAESAYVEIGARWFFHREFFIMGQAAYDYQRFEGTDESGFEGTLEFHSWFASFGVGAFF